MSEKRIVWTVIGGASILVGWRTIRTGGDPIPQLAGIGAAGIMLLFTAEIAPKFASGLAVLLGISLAYNWDKLPTLAEKPLGGGGTLTGTSPTPTAPGGGGGGAW